MDSYKLQALTNTYSQLVLSTKCVIYKQFKFYLKYMASQGIII